MFKFKLNLQTFGNRQGKPYKDGKPKNDPTDKKEPASQPEKKGAPKSNIGALRSQAGNLMATASHVSTFKLAGKEITVTGEAGAVAHKLGISNKIVNYITELTPGICLTQSDAFNKAIIDLYSRVRGRYTTQIPFQPNDLGAYILATGQIVALTGLIIRAIKSLKVNVPDNILTPYAYHMACLGTNASASYNDTDAIAAYKADVKNAATDLFRLEAAVARMNAFIIPKMPWYDFCAWVYRYAFFEDNTEFRGDIAMFSPGSVMRFATIHVDGQTGAEAPVASGIQYLSLNGLGDGTISGLIDALNYLIDDLANDDSVRSMSGWIRQYLSESYAMDQAVSLDGDVPVQGDVFESLIRGLRIANHGNQDQDIYQDPNTECLVNRRGVTTNVVDKCATNWVLNFAGPCTDEEVANASLLAVTTVKGLDGVFRYDTDVMYCTNAIMINLSPTGGLRGFNVDFVDAGSEPQVRILLAHEMDIRPPFVFYKANSSLSALESCTYESNIAFQVEISAQNIKDMHFASICSMFSCSVAEH